VRVPPVLTTQEREYSMYMCVHVHVPHRQKSIAHTPRHIKHTYENTVNTIQNSKIT